MATSGIRLVVKFELNEDKLSLLKSEVFTNLIKETRKEKGSLHEF